MWRTGEVIGCVVPDRAVITPIREAEEIWHGTFVTSIFLRCGVLHCGSFQGKPLPNLKCSDRLPDMENDVEYLDLSNEQAASGLVRRMDLRMACVLFYFHGSSA
jgi:hypothetical protein